MTDAELLQHIEDRFLDLCKVADTLADSDSYDRRQHIMTALYHIHLKHPRFDGRLDLTETTSYVLTYWLNSDPGKVYTCRQKSREGIMVIDCNSQVQA